MPSWRCQPCTSYPNQGFGHIPNKIACKQHASHTQGKPLDTSKKATAQEVDRGHAMATVRA